MCVINFVTNPLYMAYVLHMPSATFYPDILRNVLSCGVLTALFCGLSRLYMPGSWLTLILCGGFCALFGAPLHLLIVCSRDQLGALKALVRRAPEHEEENK